jgi:hypothetical protein
MDSLKQDNYKLVCEAIANIALMDDIATIEEQADVCIILGRIKNKLQSN